MDPSDNQEDRSEVNQDVWKKFGRGNEVGNMLYGIYGAGKKPQIAYPAVKTKKRPTPAEELKMPKEGLTCPQKTVIEYPDLPSKPHRKFHAVDFIPRKKHEDEIQKEISKEKNKPLVCYGKRGQDRGKMIEELQEIYQFGDRKMLDA